MTEAQYDYSHITGALRLCTKFRRAIDGGANRGDVTVMLSERFQHTVAFEPGSKIWPTLLTRVQERRAEGTVVALINAALGNVTKEGVWCGHDGARTNPRSWFTDVDREGETKMWKLDDFLNRDQPVDFIKLDLEGGELNALYGMERILKENAPVVVAETDKKSFGRANDPQGKKLFTFMRNLGYCVALTYPKDTVWIKS